MPELVCRPYGSTNSNEAERFSQSSGTQCMMLFGYGGLGPLGFHNLLHTKLVVVCVQETEIPSGVRPSMALNWPKTLQTLHNIPNDPFIPSETPVLQQIFLCTEFSKTLNERYFLALQRISRIETLRSFFFGKPPQKFVKPYWGCVLYQWCVDR